MLDVSIFNIVIFYTTINFLLRRICTMVSKITPLPPTSHLLSLFLYIYVHFAENVDVNQRRSNVVFEYRVKYTFLLVAYVLHSTNTANISVLYPSNLFVFLPASISEHISPFVQYFVNKNISSVHVFSILVIWKLIVSLCPCYNSNCHYPTKRTRLPNGKPIQLAKSQPLTRHLRDNHYISYIHIQLLTLDSIDQ